MNARPDFEWVVEGAAAARSAGFARAVLRRFHPRSIGWALLVACATAFVVDNSLVPHREPAWFRPEPLLSMVTAYLTIYVATMIADEFHARGAPRLCTYATAVVAGAAVGAELMWHVVSAVMGPITFSDGPGGLRVILPAMSFVSTLLVGGLAVGVYVNRRTALAAMRRMAAAEQARAAARRRTLESQLQVLQARVEPRFLFDTLAQVRDLYESDAARAGTMLEDLIAYLRAALPHLRRSSSTLAREIELVRAFLDIARSGSDRRFDFSLAIDAVVSEAALPGMLLLPLVQHALTHASALAVDARAADGRLRVVLDVDGPAFSPAPAQVDLEALRERLRALYGDAAQLALAQGSDRGSRAILELPLAQRDDNGDEEREGR